MCSDTSSARLDMPVTRSRLSDSSGVGAAKLGVKAACQKAEGWTPAVWRVGVHSVPNLQGAGAGRWQGSLLCQICRAEHRPAYLAQGLPSSFAALCTPTSITIKRCCTSLQQVTCAACEAAAYLRAARPLVPACASGAALQPPPLQPHTHPGTASSTQGVGGCNHRTPCLNSPDR